MNFGKAIKYSYIQILSVKLTAVILYQVCHVALLLDRLVKNGNSNVYKNNVSQHFCKELWKLVDLQCESKNLRFHEVFPIG